MAFRQLGTMQKLTGVSLSIVTEVAGYRRALTCTNAWDGYDLTHQFLDERSTAVYGPSQGSRFEQEASLRMMPANNPSLPPTSAPNPVPMTPTYSGSPAFGASYGTQQMTLQTPINQTVSDREPSGSRLPPVPNLNLIGRSTGEQAVIVALRAVANYPNSPTSFGQSNRGFQGCLDICKPLLSPRAAKLLPL